MSKSFSLIEVVIFVAILAMFFVTGMIVVVYSLQSMRLNQHRVLATQYAQQLVTWVRTQKEADWILFINNHTASWPGYTYCFNDASIPDWPASQGTCSSYALGTPPLFKREVALIQSGTAPNIQVAVTVTMTWTEAGNTYQIPLNTVFTQWQ